MSGGCFSYENDGAAREIFGWDLAITCGLKDNQEDAKEAARMNPLHDREISELAYDFFCLLHSFDWYISADTGREDYEKDLQFFKEKWFKGSKKERVDFLVKRAIERIEQQADKEIKEIIRIKDEK